MLLKKKEKSGALKLNLLTHHFTLYIWVQCPATGSTAAIFLFKRLFLICSRLSYSPTAIESMRSCDLWSQELFTLSLQTLSSVACNLEEKKKTGSSSKIK